MKYTYSMIIILFFFEMEIYLSAQGKGGKVIYQVGLAMGYLWAGGEISR